MKIAVVGAGFSGLSAARSLLKRGHEVTIFEKDAEPGGLAIGFKEKGWDWPLEKHYHHIFETDKFIQKLADEIGYPYKFFSAKSYSVFENNNKLDYWQFDSPESVLRFGRLPIIDRLRMASALGYLKYLAKWNDLERVLAVDWLIKAVGKRGYSEVWEPLFVGKFGKYANQVNAAWFWARIKARSSKLGYFDYGFLGFAQAILKDIKNRGGVAKMGQEIKNMDKIINDYDKIIIDGANNLVKQRINYLGTINVVLRLKKKLLPHDIYWLNVNIPNSPIMAVVEHTNLIDMDHYHNEHLVYLGKYLPHDDPKWTMSDAELLDSYTPWLNKLNGDWEASLIGYHVFRAKFTQPVMPINYSKDILGFETNDPKVLAIGMQQVYPWDRGTNFAVELGEKIIEYV